MFVGGTENIINDNDNDNNIFAIKDTKLHVPVVTLSASDNQKLSKHLSKGFEKSVYSKKYKTKNENKNSTNEYRYFLKSNFVGVNRLFVLVYTKEASNAQRFNAPKYYLPKDIIKYYDVYINDSDIKRYEEISKLTTGQGEDYTTECLLDYEYIKNHY